MLECKQLYSVEKLREVVNDIKRIQDPAMQAGVAERHTGVRPKHVHAVILADTWDPRVAKWWSKEPDTGCKWSREGLPDGWEYGSIEVFKVSDRSQGTLHWVFGISPALTLTETTSAP